MNGYVNKVRVISFENSRRSQSILSANDYLYLMEITSVQTLLYPTNYHRSIGSIYRTYRLRAMVSKSQENIRFIYGTMVRAKAYEHGDMFLEQQHYVLVRNPSVLA